MSLGRLFDLFRRKPDPLDARLESEQQEFFELLQRQHDSMFAKVEVEITPQMIEAGIRVLFTEFEGKFDAIDNDAGIFVERLFAIMEEARIRDNQESDQSALSHDKKSNAISSLLPLGVREILEGRWAVISPHGQSWLASLARKLFHLVCL